MPKTSYRNILAVDQKLVAYNSVIGKTLCCFSWSSSQNKIKIPNKIPTEPPTSIDRTIPKWNNQNSKQIQKTSSSYLHNKTKRSPQIFIESSAITKCSIRTTKLQWKVQKPTEIPSLVKIAKSPKEIEHQQTKDQDESSANTTAAVRGVAVVNNQLQTNFQSIQVNSTCPSIIFVPLDQWM